MLHFRMITEVKQAIVEISNKDKGNRNGKEVFDVVLRKTITGFL